MTQRFVYNDGGRKASGFTKDNVGDCVTRAVAIASGLPYIDVWNCLAEKQFSQRKTKRTRATKEKTADRGISAKRKWFDDYMQSIGFTWIPTMKIGQGCKVHLIAEELPMGNLVVSVSRHMVAVIDGVIHDTYDCTRDGKRCVYGYYIKK